MSRWHHSVCPHFAVKFAISVSHVFALRHVASLTDDSCPAARVHPRIAVPLQINTTSSGPTLKLLINKLVTSRQLQLLIWCQGSSSSSSTMSLVSGWQQLFVDDVAGVRVVAALRRRCRLCQGRSSSSLTMILQVSRQPWWDLMFNTDRQMFSNLANTACHSIHDVTSSSSQCPTFLLCLIIHNVAHVLSCYNVYVTWSNVICEILYADNRGDRQYNQSYIREHHVALVVWNIPQWPL